ncbi:Cdc15p [Rhizophagus irregularis DAOM 197198w]|uniref:Cdc15p n=1 Tax=Rhizophagus irregularis (strain DAOM 197198w) TaxID=1432141 RepID=A0A015I8L3_RHIIW|nr:Cdc15p [Rhizophagus irregularis DAOM 197198w]
MEPVNTIDENSFDPTPRLKSSPIPIKFISFNKGDENCISCGEKYIQSLLSYEQKYCKKCLSSYINDTTDYNLYLDVLVDLECSDHEINKTKVPQSIQEFCGDLKILSFKQILENHSTPGGKYDKVYKSEKYCKLCGKSLLHRETYVTKEFIFCSNCYLMFTERMESSLIKKKISIFYIPWWHTVYKCDVCYSTLIFTSDCQKYCSNCYIFYVGCRYCLTTNIIFGPTGQTQCKKCKRISFIIILCDNLAKFENTVNNLDKYFMPTDILDAMLKKNIIIPIKWIPYSQFKDVKEMTRGGYGIIYKATWLSNNETVILKRFENSKNNIKYFLNELKSSHHCYSRNFQNHIIKIYGFTKDPELGDYVLIMKYATEGDLHKYLQKEFTNITWNYQKLRILWQISEGLEHVHKNKFIHRDFHSGNMLFDLNTSAGKNYQWKIGDLGLSQEINNESSNNEIYGIIPYIAPEIFKGSSFSKKADVYSLGMVMWELTTGCKPFDNVKHDHNLIYNILDGERPKITEDTPECYANLMKSCWDPDPTKRPSIKDIRLTFGRWTFKGKNKAEFIQAETKRMELIQSKKLGPEFAEKRHSEANYISRPLSALISKCLSTNSSSISIGNKKGINKEKSIVNKNTT